MLTERRSEGEAASWANALHEASDEGVFFGASNYYTYIARRPESSGVYER